jgi:putative sterol carrier protein
MDQAMLKLPQAFLRQEAVGLNAVVHFKFTGAEAGEWNAVIQDGICQVARGIPQRRPSLSVTADSTEFIQILERELDPIQAYMSGRVKVAGDMSLAAKLMQAFATR